MSIQVFFQRTEPAVAVSTKPKTTTDFIFSPIRDINGTISGPKLQRIFYHQVAAKFLVLVFQSPGALNFPYT